MITINTGGLHFSVSGSWYTDSMDPEREEEMLLNIAAGTAPPCAVPTLNTKILPHSIAAIGVFATGRAIRNCAT